MKSPEKAKKYEERLEDAFAFNELDLEANRGGRLTAQQIYRLNKARGRAVMMWALPTILTVMVLLFWLAFSQGVSSLIDGLLPFALSALVIAGAYAYGGLKARRLEADMRDAEISTVEGPVELIVGGVQYGVAYLMRVGGEQFLLKKDAFFALKNGDPYRVYYTTRSKQPLAVEWLREVDEHLLDAAGSETEKEPAQMELVALDEKPKRFTD